jgi:hypothetical protein
MAKEVDIGAQEAPFIESLEAFAKEGEQVGVAVLDALGGPAGLSNKLPFDRGDANRALVSLCLRLADAVQNSELAERLIPAATPTDFRRVLLTEHYDIIHFASHSDGENLVFEDQNGNSSLVPLSAVAEAVTGQKSLKAVILNACESGKTLSKSIAKHTIAMSEVVDDDAAIEFTSGFYDALSLGKNIPEAFKEGVMAVKLSGNNADHIQLLTDEQEQSEGRGANERNSAVHVALSRD